MGKVSRQLRGRKNTKKGKPEILTSSPYKNALKSAIKEKDENIKNKAIATFISNVTYLHDVM